MDEEIERQMAVLAEVQTPNALPSPRCKQSRKTKAGDHLTGELLCAPDLESKTLAARAVFREDPLVLQASNEFDVTAY